MAERVIALRAGYDPPDFAHVPGPDAAIFLCAVDHKTGYEKAHEVGGAGPFSGSELMWNAALACGLELRAERLADIDAETVAESFRIDDETVTDLERRAALWRDLAGGLIERYGGEARAMLEAAERRLAGPGGLLERLSVFEAYSDPLAKKAQLFAKICERRGWFAVDDPGSWQVSADNVLMRLALRSGLVAQGGLDQVRAATRDAFKLIAELTEIPPPVLDDMLWELGRSNPDLLGSVAGDLSEPGRDPESTWY